MTEKLTIKDLFAGKAIANSVISTANLRRPTGAAPSNPILARRSKFKEAIAQQTHYVDCDKNGVIPEVKGTKYVKDEEGKGHGVETTKRPIRWYFKSGSDFVLTIKYGTSQLFDDGFKCRNLDEVAEILNEFNEIADSGKLDNLFESVKRPGRKPATFA